MMGSGGVHFSLPSISIVAGTASAGASRNGVTGLHALYRRLSERRIFRSIEISEVMSACV